jgi:hypothetical protein
MLQMFTIAKVERTEREYEYSNYPFTGKLKKAIEYIYELSDENGERYFIFHQRKTDPAMRQYKIMYVDAAKMESRDGTKYSAPYEGAYKVRRIYSKDEFAKTLSTQIENLATRQKADWIEVQRLMAIEKK